MVLPLLEPIMSEKAVRDQARGLYHFWAQPGITKQQAAQWLEKLFGVRVTGVRSLQRKGKVKMNWNKRRLFRRPARKKFLIQLASGTTIKELTIAKK